MNAYVSYVFYHTYTQKLAAFSEGTVKESHQSEERDNGHGGECEERDNGYRSLLGLADSGTDAVLWNTLEVTRHVFMC